MAVGVTSPGGFYWNRCVVGQPVLHEPQAGRQQVDRHWRAGQESAVEIENGQIDGDRLIFKVGPFRLALWVYGDEIKGEMQGVNGPVGIYLKRVRWSSWPMQKKSPQETSRVGRM
jgi:hypothetical protein